MYLLTVHSSFHDPAPVRLSSSSFFSGGAPATELAAKMSSKLNYTITNPLSNCCCCIGNHLPDYCGSFSNYATAINYDHYFRGWEEGTYDKFVSRSAYLLYCDSDILVTNEMSIIIVNPLKSCCCHICGVIDFSFFLARRMIACMICN